MSQPSSKTGAGLAPPIQATPTETSSSSSIKLGRATHTISVAPKQSPHAYEPRSVRADVGDEILFEFYPSNHSVVKADFDAPCVPATHDVFFSGHFELTSYTTVSFLSFSLRFSSLLLSYPSLWSTLLTPFPSSSLKYGAGRSILRRYIASL